MAGFNAWMREQMDLQREMAAEDAQRLRDLARRKAANLQGFKERMAAARAARDAQEA